MRDMDSVSGTAIHMMSCVIYHNDDRGPPHRSLGASAAADAASYDTDICSTRRPTLLSTGVCFVHCLIDGACLWYGNTHPPLGVQGLERVNKISGVYTPAGGGVNKSLVGIGLLATITAAPIVITTWTITVGVVAIHFKKTN